MACSCCEKLGAKVKNLRQQLFAKKKTLRKAQWKNRRLQQKSKDPGLTWQQKCQIPQEADQTNEEESISTNESCDEDFEDDPDFILDDINDDSNSDNETIRYCNKVRSLSSIMKLSIYNSIYKLFLIWNVKFILLIHFNKFHFQCQR